MGPAKKGPRLISRHSPPSPGTVSSHLVRPVTVGSSVATLAGMGAGPQGPVNRPMIGRRLGGNGEDSPDGKSELTWKGSESGETAGETPAATGAGTEIWPARSPGNGRWDGRHASSNACAGVSGVGACSPRRVGKCEGSRSLYQSAPLEGLPARRHTQGHVVWGSEWAALEKRRGLANARIPRQSRSAMSDGKENCKLTR